MKSDNILIVTGGSIDEELLMNTVDSFNRDVYIIGVDKGLETLDKLEIKPDLVIGDFDSANDSIRAKYVDSPDAVILNPEKDYTDTHVAVLEALKHNPVAITIMGAIGTRIDHMLGNIALLKICLMHDVDAVMLDKHNRIRMIDKHMILRRDELYGKYISCIPFSDRVTGINLRGFKYELTDATMIKEETIGISNELGEEEGHISIGSGYLLVMETKD